MPGVSRHGTEPVQVILDTDIDTDCDDTGALAVLHALCDRGEARILGINASVPYAPTAACVGVINHYYGRTEIPVGLLAGSLETDPRFERYREVLRKNTSNRDRGRYNKVIACEQKELVERLGPPRESVRFYRELLAGSLDGSIAVVAIGLLTALQELLQSGPDGISRLDGVELVRAKVTKLVTMAEAPFPSGKEAFNWRMDREAAAGVLEVWPTPVVVSSAGTKILTGSTLSRRTPSTNPVRRAYEIYLGGEGRSRPSWDLAAVLYAVRGGAGHFSEISDHRVELDASSAEYRWTPAGDGRPIHTYLKQNASDEELVDLLEDLMCAEPGWH